MIGARGGLILVIAYVDFKLAAHAPPLPVQEAVAHAIEERSAAQVQVTDQHAAEVGDVADVVPSRSQRAEELDCAHDGHVGAHRQGDGGRDEPDPAVPEHYSSTH